MLAAALVAVGVAGAISWSRSDLPSQGEGDYAFSAAVVERLPEGFNRVRPALIQELPPDRPALLFPHGVSYPEAIHSYYLARERREQIPANVTLTAPLPTGIAVSVGRDRRVAIDPAAPLGWDPRTHLIATAFRGVGLQIPRLVLPRCQVLLPDQDAAPADCSGTQGREYITADGRRWLAGLNGVRSPDSPRLVGSTDLSVLERPARAADTLPPRIRAGLADRDHTFGGPAQGGDLDLEAARHVSTGGTNAYVVPSRDGERVCLWTDAAAGGAAGTCNPRTVLITFGAIPLITNHRYSGLVGDGYDTVTVGDKRYPIRDNVFSVPLPPNTGTITLSGALGTHRLSTFGR
ncbi:MAG: hypothetical protein AB7G65_13780 [Thermoleophilia bacterium]